jgi:hypothetical protein
MTTTSRSVATSIGIDYDLTNDCRALGVRSRAERWSFADDLLVLTQANELECLKWLSPVHSTNSNWATSSGFSHWQSAIFAFVSPWPHRPLRASGRFANGQSLILEALEFLEHCARNTGVKPLRVLATHINFSPSLYPKITGCNAR